jgi:hypothetical protein
MEGAVEVERLEAIKWADALDVLAKKWGDDSVEKGLQMTRECAHPDAQWLAALIPPGVEVTRKRMQQVMLEQGDDPRGLFLAWLLDANRSDISRLERAAEAGYAPAQGRLCTKKLMFKWAQRAALQMDRRGLYHLGRCYSSGRSCTVDNARANELCRRAAELNFPPAQAEYGMWLKRVLFTFLPSFERGKNIRILHTTGDLISRNLDAAERKMLGERYDEHQVQVLQRVVEAHHAALRARAAIACWSVVGLRCGVSKDIRVLIGKMVWEEKWRRSEKVVVKTVVSQPDEAQDWQEHGE